VSTTRGHEPYDIVGRPIALAAAGLGVVLFVVALAQLGLIHWFDRREQARSAPPAPLAETRTAPEPRLLSDPRAALLQLRAEEDGLLHSYGWVNREAGIVRIPIERAIDLLAKKAPGR
jgi:hypothetical protein